MRPNQRRVRTRIRLDPTTQLNMAEPSSFMIPKISNECLEQSRPQQRAILQSYQSCQRESLRGRLPPTKSRQSANESEGEEDALNNDTMSLPPKDAQRSHLPRMRVKYGQCMQKLCRGCRQYCTDRRSDTGRVTQTPSGGLREIHTLVLGSAWTEPPRIDPGSLLATAGAAIYVNILCPKEDAPGGKPVLPVFQALKEHLIGGSTLT